MDHGVRDMAEVRAHRGAPAAPPQDQQTGAPGRVDELGRRGPDHWLLIAAAEAQVREASLRLLSVGNVLAHVGRFTTMLDSIGEITEEKAHETAAMADRIRKRYPGLTVTHDVETGTSVPGILVEATDLTDLLVIGARHRVIGAGSALGRVTHGLLHHGRCPVQIVPPGFAATGDGFAAKGGGAL